MNDQTKKPPPTPSGPQAPISVPRGIEVLLKKAAVDREFREMLVRDRSRAAAANELKLDPAEEAMLEAIPSEQLQLMITQTGIPVEQWRPSTNEGQILVTGIRPYPAVRHARPMAVPRGIEVLLKKAAVDPEFRQLLMDQRGGAAAAIELELHPAETAMLQAIPAEQLAQLISQTVVPVEQRRVFLGRVAAAMLTMVGVGLVGCEPRAESAGVRPDRPEPAPMQSNDASSNAAATQVSSTNPPAASAPPVSRGIRPDRP